ncbi:MAG TPA: type II secretion system minor pseudopilin GspK, partial [Candidatus Bathyarchaeia archaeon]|nr:type II secretion system minor pseudopilin GspK [Candidatus Bathyarchaeia archaeon]
MPLNKTGSILVVTLWILIILTLLGLMVAHRSGIELAFSNYQLNKTRSKYIAWAGLIYSMDQIRQDLMDQDLSEIDTAYACGVVLPEGKRPRDLFQGQTLGGGVFDLSFEREGRVVFGFEDETGKLNLNALDEGNAAIFKYLMLDLGLDEGEAEVIAASVVDWIDADDTVFQESNGAENEYYQGLPRAYDCKNQPMESLWELLLVRGMTPEIFEKVKPYVTVLPSAAGVKVNFNTAPRPVLAALARSVAGARTNTNLLDAGDFVERVVDYRAGADGEWGTEDDRPLEFSEISFTSSGRAIAAALMVYAVKRADFIRVHAVG